MSTSFFASVASNYQRKLKVTFCVRGVITPFCPKNGKTFTKRWPIPSRRFSKDGCLNFTELRAARTCILNRERYMDDVRLLQALGRFMNPFIKDFFQFFRGEAYVMDHPLVRRIWFVLRTHSQSLP